MSNSNNILNNKTLYTSIITSFQNSGNKNYGIFHVDTLADSKDQLLLTLPKVEVNVVFKNNKLAEISNDTLNTLYKSAQNEIYRVIFAQTHLKGSAEYNTYSKAAQNFIMFPYLNEAAMQQAVEDGIISDVEFSKVWNNGEYRGRCLSNLLNIRCYRTTFYIHLLYYKGTTFF